MLLFLTLLLKEVPFRPDPTYHVPDKNKPLGETPPVLPENGEA
jgi:hypothetical protein